MRLRYKMVMVPNEPKELKVGMLCRSLVDGADPNAYYFLDESSDLSSLELNQSVNPFIVSKDKTSECEKGKVYLFEFNDGGCCVGTIEEVFDVSEINSSYEVIVGPEQIGLVNKNGKPENIGLADLNSIMSQEGWCYVDMEDEFTAPEKFEHVGWGDSLPEVILHDGKCLLTYLQ